MFEATEHKLESKQCNHISSSTASDVRYISALQPCMQGAACTCRALMGCACACRALVWWSSPNQCRVPVRVIASGAAPAWTDVAAGHMNHMQKQQVTVRHEINVNLTCMARFQGGQLHPSAWITDVAT